MEQAIYILTWVGFLANCALMALIGDHHGIFDEQPSRSERYAAESEWRR